MMDMVERMPLDPPLPVPPPEPRIPQAFVWDALAIMPAPYPHSFQGSVKGRWIGRTAVDVFAREFPYYPREFYQGQLDRSKLQVTRRGEVVAPEAAATMALKTGDLVRHVIHRHELPVVNGGPLVVCGYAPAAAAGVLSTRETDGLLCVNKPPTLPAHPCGRYHKASVAEMLAAGYFTLAPDVWQRYGKKFYDGLKRQLASEAVHTVHRLDKATSGLILVATNRRVSAAVHAALDAKSTEDVGSAKREPSPSPSLGGKSDLLSDEGETPGLTSKRYLARVRGRFPGGGEPVAVSRAIYCASHREGRFAAVSEEAEAERRRRAEEEQRRREAAEAATGDAPAVAARATEAEAAAAVAKQELKDAHHSGDAEALAAAKEKKRSAQRHATDFGRAGGADCEGPEHARWAETVFRLRHYNSADDTSVVECDPVTGRTHQLRVHLALLGHPIVLDAMYGPPEESREAVVRQLFNLGRAGLATPAPGDGSSTTEEGCPECSARGESAEWPGREFWEAFLCLHALTYTINFGTNGEATFQVPVPGWAEPEPVL